MTQATGADPRVKLFWQAASELRAVYSDDMSDDEFETAADCLLDLEVIAMYAANPRLVRMCRKLIDEMPLPSSSVLSIDAAAIRHRD